MTIGTLFTKNYCWVTDVDDPITEFSSVTSYFSRFGCHVAKDVTGRANLSMIEGGKQRDP